METTRIFFRGRNTAAIIADAAERLGPADVTIIVAREGDALAQPGDVEGVEPPWVAGEWQIICNGGTTAQLVPLLASIIRAYHADHTENTWWWTAYDVQPDGCTALAGGS